MNNKIKIYIKWLLFSILLIFSYYAFRNYAASMFLYFFSDIPMYFINLGAFYFSLSAIFFFLSMLAFISIIRSYKYKKKQIEKVSILNQINIDILKLIRFFKNRVVLRICIIIIFTITFLAMIINLINFSKERNQDWKLCKVLKGHSDFITSLCFGSNENKLFSSSCDTSMRIWDFKEGKLEKIIWAPDCIQSLKLTKNGNYVVISCNNGYMVKWDTNNNRTEIIKLAKKAILDVEISEDEKYIAIPTGDGSILICNFYNLEIIKVIKYNDSNYFSSLKFNKNLLAAINDNEDKIIIWNWKEEKIIKILKDPCYGIKGIAFSSDGKYLASIWGQKDILLWDLKNFSLEKKLIGHNDEICAIFFDNNAKYLYSASLDKTVRVWDLEKSKAKKVLKGPEFMFCTVAMTHNLNFFASVDNYKRINVWSIKKSLK